MGDSESVEVRLARIEERVGALAIRGEETQTTCKAIRDVLEAQSPRWVMIAERVGMHDRVLWALAVPVLGAVGLALWQSLAKP